jgi:hypothetical protein
MSERLSTSLFLTSMPIIARSATAAGRAIQGMVLRRYGLHQVCIKFSNHVEFGLLLRTRHR